VWIIQRFSFHAEPIYCIHNRHVVYLQSKESYSMARLPIPGEDNGTWGAILNDFLTRGHNSDGTIKTDALSISKSDVGLANADNTTDANKPVSNPTQLALDAKANDSSVIHIAGSETITGHKMFNVSPDVPYPSSELNVANKAYVDDFVLSATDATAVSKGLVQLTGDLSGTASSPTVPGLAGKANTSHVHSASDVTTGIFDVARIPTGATASTVSLGDHNHDANYLAPKNTTVTLTDSTNDRFSRVNIIDDASPTTNWSDRLAFYFGSQRTGYHNEYGELRARPAKASTVALRAMHFGSGTTNVFEVSSSSLGTLYFGVSASTATVNVPIASTQNIATSGTVTGSNIGAKVTASSTAPVSPATGDVWVDLSA
jgi:hypothetical protein